MSKRNDQRQFAGDFIYQELKRKIIELEYEPEKVLNEEGLTVELAISRTPLRQALYRLILEGLVVKQSNGRMHVATVSIHEAEEIFKVREVLEGLIAKEATANITKRQIAHLEDILESMSRAADNNRNSDVIKYGGEFHQCLYEPSKNITAVQFLDQIKSRLQRYRRLGGYKNPAYLPSLPVKEHTEIFRAITKGDAKLAEETMRVHIRNSLSVARETLEIVFAKK